MICDKCGKSNIQDLSICSYCGADMPKTSGGGGFADILSYNGTDADVNTKINSRGMETNLSGVGEADMQKLIKKSDNIMKSTRKNLLFGLIAIGLSSIILLSSIAIGVITIKSVKKYKEETITQVMETKKNLDEYKTELDTLLKKIEKDNNDDDTHESTSVYDIAKRLHEMIRNENN